MIRSCLIPPETLTTFGEFEPQLRDLLNGDPEFAICARCWTARVTLQIDDSRQFIHVVNGVVVDEPGLDRPRESDDIVLSGPSEARSRGIKGRSTMSKAQLARALGR